MKRLKNILFIFFIPIIISSCSADKDNAQELEAFSDSKYDDSEKNFQSQNTTVPTENLTDSYSDAERGVTENITVSEYEDKVQKCISDVRGRNPLEVIDTAAYDIDGDGDDEILLLLEGAIFGNSRTLYVYKVINGDIQPCGDIWALQSEICDDIFNPSAHFRPYNKIEFGKLNYNDRDYDRIICYSIRTPFRHCNHISQLKINDIGTAVEVPLLEWGMDIIQKYNGFENVPFICSYLDGEEKEISNEDLDSILLLIN